MFVAAYVINHNWVTYSSRGVSVERVEFNSMRLCAIFSGIYDEVRLMIDYSVIVVDAVYDY